MRCLHGMEEGKSLVVVWDGITGRILAHEIANESHDTRAWTTRPNSRCTAYARQPEPRGKKERKLRLPHPFPIPSFASRRFEPLVENVNERTGGQICTSQDHENDAMPPALARRYLFRLDLPANPRHRFMGGATA
jgi:hypothetical protein